MDLSITLKAIAVLIAIVALYYSIRTYYKKKEVSITTQEHSGSGDNVAGDKVMGDKVMGDKTVHNIKEDS